MLLPLDPAGPARGLDLLDVALLAQLGAWRQGRRLVAGEHAGTESSTEHGATFEAEKPTEGLVDEGEAALRIAAQDDVGLVVQEVAITGFVLADLPLDVLQRLEPPLQALTDVHEALELRRQIARIGLLLARGGYPTQAAIAHPCS